MGDEEQKGFKVTDRRIHADDDAADAPGDVAETPDEGADEAEVDAPQGDGEAGAGEPDGAPTDEAAAAEAAAAEEAAQSMPITFATFVMSLGESAMVHLGTVPNPMTGQQEANLSMARQTIDILGILEEKTRGNLDEEEERLLGGLLYTLRMQFIEAGAPPTEG